MIIFHGGCNGCLQQQRHGTDFCYDCQFFEADWYKPNLSLYVVSSADVEREKVKARRAKLGEYK